MNARLPTSLPAPGLSEEDAFGLLERTNLSEMMAEARAPAGRRLWRPFDLLQKALYPLNAPVSRCVPLLHLRDDPEAPAGPLHERRSRARRSTAGAAAGCKEALFTLGEKPELRYRAAREALEALGFPSTTAYLAHVAERVLSETGAAAPSKSRDLER